MTTLYALLNADAKAWWYFRKLREWGQAAVARENERESIRTCIRNVRTAAASNGYLLIVADQSRFVMTLSDQQVLSGHGDVSHYQRLCTHLGVPVFNLRDAAEGDSLLWNEPLHAIDRIAYYKEKLNAR